MSTIAAFLVFLLLSLTFQPISLTPTLTSSVSDLPLLPSGTHAGIIYSTPDDAARPVLDAAFNEVYQSGADIYELSIAWSDLEPVPGQIDTAELEQYLTWLSSLHIHVYLSITTINTVALTLPSDLAVAPDLILLADGRHFDDPIIVERFGAVLDAVVPLLAEHGGFFLSVGNEVEGWLDFFPDEIDPFARFVAAARDRVHQIEPGLAVGAALTQGGVVRQSPVIAPILAVSDAAVFTYYPINDDFTVRDPAVVFDDLKGVIEASGDLPILFQEVGYPSGYLPEPANGSSG
ncbi:MAG TPA: hypothetical protein VHL11_01375, partial [Phototrophicaceae bacterium]|nr:hypothetical protein [Phototrophicaceae bacterium]